MPDNTKYNALLNSLPENAIKSIFYKLAMRKARNIVSNPSRMIRLVQQGLSKINSVENKGEIITQMKQHFSLFFRMLKAFYNKQYTEISWTTLLKVATAIVYLLFIVDLIPDFIPVLGFMDDAAVLTWVVSAVKTDMDKFSNWENSRSFNAGDAAGS